MGIPRILNDYENIELIEEANEFLLLEDAVTLIVRDMAYSGDYSDEFSELVGVNDENTEWEQVYTEEFQVRTQQLRGKILAQLMEGLRAGELVSKSYYYQTDVFGSILEPTPDEIYLNPDKLADWLSGKKGMSLSEYWWDDLMDLFIEVQGRTGTEIAKMRLMLSACTRV